MCSFIEEFVTKSKKDLVISAGAETNNLIDGVKEKFSKKGVFEINGKKIIILDNISFIDLKLIIKIHLLNLCLIKTVLFQSNLLDQHHQVCISEGYRLL